MPTDIIMPQMGESIVEGTITKWLKKAGDKVQRDEPLFEISTDKVDAEIPAPASGVLQEIKVSEGTTVGVNTVVGTIAADGEAAAPARPAPAASTPEKSASEKPAPEKKPAAPATPGHSVRGTPRTRCASARTGTGRITPRREVQARGRPCSPRQRGLLRNEHCAEAEARPARRSRFRRRTPPQSR